MSSQDFPFFSTRVDGEVLAIAHRGGMGDERENTPAALMRTVAPGFRYLEIDLRATADSHPVVWHGRDVE